MYSVRNITISDSALRSPFLVSFFCFYRRQFLAAKQSILFRLR